MGNKKDTVPDGIFPDGNSLGQLKLSVDVAEYAPLLNYVGEIATGAAIIMNYGSALDDMLIHLQGINSRLAKFSIAPIYTFDLTPADLKRFENLIPMATEIQEGIVNYVAEMIGVDNYRSSDIIKLIFSTYGKNHSLDAMVPNIKTLAVLTSVTLLGLAAPEVGFLILANAGIEVFTGKDILFNLAHGEGEFSNMTTDPLWVRLTNLIFLTVGSASLFFNKSLAQQTEEIELLMTDAERGMYPKPEIEARINMLKEDSKFRSLIRERLTLATTFVTSPARSVATNIAFNGVQLPWDNYKSTQQFHAIPQGILDTQKRSTPLKNLEADLPSQMAQVNAGQGTKVANQIRTADYPEGFVGPIPRQNLFDIFTTNTGNGPQIVYTKGLDGSTLIFGYLTPR